MTDSAEKTCPMCGTIFARRPGQTHQRWAERKTCGRICGIRLTTSRPDWRQRMSEGRKAYFRDNPEAKATLVAAATARIVEAQKFADRAKGGRTKSMQALGWCPPDRLPEYRRLRGLYGAEEARRMMRETFTAEAKRAVAAAEAAMRARHQAELGSRY